VTLRPLAAALAVAAAAPAAAFVQLRTEAGAPVAWPVPLVPYQVNAVWPEAAPSCGGPASFAPALAAIRASFAEWERPCSGLSLLYAGSLAERRTGLGGASENLVLFRQGFCSKVVQNAADPCWADLSCPDVYGCFDDGCSAGAHSCVGWGYVAVTSDLYDVSTGRMLGADMELNGPAPGTANTVISSGQGFYFTCLDPGSIPSTSICSRYGEASCWGMDLRNTVTHEAGHFVGLRHPCSADGVNDADLPLCSGPIPAGETIPWAQRAMYPTTEMGDVAKRTLSEDDVAGVCAAYPVPSGGCGCGAGGGGTAASLLLAALAWRHARLRRR
jgi:hypothetical protein